MKFAKDVIDFAGSLPKSIANVELVKQLVRWSGSVGANYIEANEALSKEAKESRYWLMLIETNGEDADRRRQSLVGEATELMKIFGSIVEKVQ